MPSTADDHMSNATMMLPGLPANASAPAAPPPRERLARHIQQTNARRLRQDVCTLIDYSMALPGADHVQDVRKALAVLNQQVDRPNNPRPATLSFGLTPSDRSVAPGRRQAMWAPGG